MRRIKLPGTPESLRFPRVFWIANFMELFERIAYYGMFAVLSIYMTDSIGEGGLGFSQQQRGTMQAIVTSILYLLPILGGVIADRYGFRKILLIAFVILTSGYYLMGQMNSYSPFFLMFLVVAIGAALFKPIIVSTVSKTTTRKNDTVGFGIFYMIVNIGGFIGPFLASKLRVIQWDYVFIMCSVAILINIIPALFWYKEPGREKQKQRAPLKTTLTELVRNLYVALKDYRFMIFILIMSGFWIMYMQIFFTLPLYIKHWVDTTVIYNSSKIIADIFGHVEDGVGIINPEMLQNLGALSIVLFQLLVSLFVKRFRPLLTITVGIGISAVAMSQMGVHINAWFMVGLIFIFALGEMASSPRTQEYVGRIAPKEKVAMYMGYSFLPIAIGNLTGGLLSGFWYAKFSDKTSMIIQEMSNHGYQHLARLKEISYNNLMTESASFMNLEEAELTSMLIDKYHPGQIWMMFGAIGAMTVLLFILFDRFVVKKKNI